MCTCTFNILITFFFSIRASHRWPACGCTRNVRSSTCRISMDVYQRLSVAKQNNPLQIDPKYDVPFNGISDEGMDLCAGNDLMEICILHLGSWRSIPTAHKTFASIASKLESKKWGILYGFYDGFVVALLARVSAEAKVVIVKVIVVVARAPVKSFQRIKTVPADKKLRAKRKKWGVVKR